MKETVYIGLGGNVGDVLSNMASALGDLHSNDDTKVSRVSDVYKTPPWGLVEQDWFLNCCAEIETSLDPYQLLDLCLKTEKKLKRERSVRWGPRSVDIDILIFGNINLAERSLTIPHPRMHERAFVMLPLADIAPALDVGGKTPLEWVKELDVTEISKMDVSSDWWLKNTA